MGSRRRAATRVRCRTSLRGQRPQQELRPLRVPCRLPQRQLSRLVCCSETHSALTYSLLLYFLRESRLVSTPLGQSRDDKSIGRTYRPTANVRIGNVRVGHANTERCVSFYCPRYQSIANTIVQLIRRSASDLIAASWRCLGPLAEYSKK